MLFRLLSSNPYLLCKGISSSGPAENGLDGLERILSSYHFVCRPIDLEVRYRLTRSVSTSADMRRENIHQQEISLGRCFVDKPEREDRSPEISAHNLGTYGYSYHWFCRPAKGLMSLRIHLQGYFWDDSERDRSGHMTPGPFASQHLTHRVLIRK